MGNKQILTVRWGTQDDPKHDLKLETIVEITSCFLYRTSEVRRKDMDYGCCANRNLRLSTIPAGD